MCLRLFLLSPGRSTILTLIRRLDILKQKRGKYGYRDTNRKTVEKAKQTTQTQEWQESIRLQDRYSKHWSTCWVRSTYTESKSKNLNGSRSILLHKAHVMAEWFVTFGSFGLVLQLQISAALKPNQATTDFTRIKSSVVCVIGAWRCTITLLNNDDMVYDKSMMKCIQ